MPIKNKFSKTNCKILNSTIKNITDYKKLIKIIEKTLFENPPVNINKGGAILSDFNNELRELRSFSKNNVKFLENMLKEQSELTNIPSLKISSNNVFGYYIEVRNTHKDKVPEHWIRKQTLVNAERYITEELKEFESKILGAEEKIMELEIKFYNELLDRCQLYIKDIQTPHLLFQNLIVFYDFVIYQCQIIMLNQLLMSH